MFSVGLGVPSRVFLQGRERTAWHRWWGVPFRCLPGMGCPRAGCGRASGCSAPLSPAQHGELDLPASGAVQARVQSNSGAPASLGAWFEGHPSLREVWDASVAAMAAVALGEDARAELCARVWCPRRPACGPCQRASGSGSRLLGLVRGIHSFTWGEGIIPNS